MSHSHSAGMQKQPLVSIIVITFNSAKYILETLESIRAQTYQNIELIISDDASKDNTVEISRTWIEANKDRFTGSELIIVAENSGIPANCNRGIKAAHGEWIKLIAGDDALFQNAIEMFVEYTRMNKDTEVLLTQGEMFIEIFDPKNSLGIHPGEIKSRLLYSERATATDQLEYLLGGGFHFTPGLFIKNFFNEIGLYDEDYTLSEDIPFYLKLGLKGKVIKFAPLLTIKYRKHKDSLTNKERKILPPYMHQAYTAAYNASKKHGKFKFIVNNFWNKIIIGFIFLIGNHGVLCSAINKLRISLQPIRFFNLFSKLLKLKPKAILLVC